MSYTLPATPKSGYSFVPAAVTFNKYKGLSIFIKYRPGPKKVRCKQQGPTHVWYECPDREIVITMAADGEQDFIPWGHSFDECIDLNPYNDKVSQNLDLEYLMLNYVHQGDQTLTPRYKASTAPEKRVTVMSDSGGLQMSRGIIDMIDPVDLMNFYNANVDAGMSLDLPLPPGLIDDGDKYLMRCGLMQKKNNEIMLAQGGTAELINIIPGKTAEARNRYAEIVADKRITRAAVGGIGGTGYMTRSCLSSADFIYSLLEACPGYKQYHILGVYSGWMIPVLVKMANSGPNPAHLTSDSTSYVQSAIRHVYHFQFDMYHVQKRIPIGRNGSVMNSYKQLPCQCTVCRAIKWTDVLGFGDMRFVSSLLSIHNAYEMQRWAASLQEACRTMPTSDFNQMIYRALGHRQEVREVKRAFDYIDVAAKAGVTAARKKWASAMTLELPSTGSTDEGLFGAAGHDTESSLAAGVVEKFKSVLSEFETYHGIVPKGRTKKR